MERLSYGELLRAGWMLLWRIVTAIFGLVFIIDTLLIWTMPELVRSAPSLWASAVPLTLTVLLTLFVSCRGSYEHSSTSGFGDFTSWLSTAWAECPFSPTRRWTSYEG
jgi:hypothetical protein